MLVARILGIDIRIHVSWFLIFGLVLLSLSDRVLPAIRPTWSDEKTLIVAAVAAVLFFGSVLAHELAHAVVARAFRMPVTSITLFLLGGVANLAKEPPSARAEFLMASAGPLTSLILGGAGLGLAEVAGQRIDTFPALDPVEVVASYLGLINLALAAFNMIPGFPLDGGRVLRSVVWGVARNRSAATRIAARGGQLVAVLLVIGGVARSFTNGDAFSAIWMGLIAYFLYNAATAALDQERLTATVSGVRVSALMTTEFHSVPAHTTVGELISDHILPYNTRAVAVLDGAVLLGLVTIGDLRNVHQRDWPVTPVDRVMRPASELPALSPDDRLLTAIERFSENAIPVLPVVKGSALVGVLEREAVASYVRMRDMLGVDGRR